MWPYRSRSIERQWRMKRITELSEYYCYMGTVREKNHSIRILLFPATVFILIYPHFHLVIFLWNNRYGALAFALIQAVGQCLYVRPYVDDFSVMWLAESTAVLTAGAMILMYIGEILNELKLGNGTSLLIFANIVSSLPSSIGRTVEQSKTDGNGAFTLAVFFGAFLLSTLGVVYVQEAERKIPMQYSTKFNSQGAGLSKSSY